MAQPANSIAVANPGAKPNGDCRQIKLNNKTYEIFLYADDQEISLERQDWQKLTASVNTIFQTTILPGVVEFEIELEPSINKSTNELIYRASNYQFRSIDGTIIADTKTTIKETYKSLVDKIAGLFSQLHLKIPNLSLPSLNRKGSEYQLMPQVPKKTTAFSPPVQPKPEVNNVAMLVFNEIERKKLIQTITEIKAHREHENYGACFLNVYHELTNLKFSNKLVETHSNHADEIVDLVTEYTLQELVEESHAQSILLTYYLEYLIQTDDYIPSKNILNLL